MFLYIICFILGAIISLFLYACIIVGKDSDKTINIEEMENQNEWRKSN